jgi:uncharacterized membrane protein
VDTDETVSVLRTLGDDEVRPPMVDLDLAIRTGRQRLRRRRTACVTGAVAAVVALVAAAPFTVQLTQGRPAGEVSAGTPPASAPTASASAPAGPTSFSCVEARLATPHAGQQALVTGADPSGRFIVGRVYSGGHPTQVAMWDNGKLHTLTIPGEDATLEDVNSAGVAVGDSYPSGTVSAGWIYANATLSRLPGSEGASPVAINDQGTIVGGQTRDGALGYPIVWHSATSEPVRLPLPADALGGGVADIDSDGTIVGTFVPPSTGTPLARGIVWRPDGTSEVLPLPTDLVDGVNGLEIHAIRHGVITAAATISSRTGKSLIPVTYDLSTGRFTVLPGANIWIQAANAQGAIAGEAGPGPALYTPTTGVVQLPTLRTSTAPALASMATTISDDGLLLSGQDEDDNGVIHAVTWTCR